ncbi:MAG: hypothetical protein ABJN42_27725, partial [Roseibium sp.]|uniref:hypothetical protein n=1 Tax=Roseibium sp. TaxID=1936156 RepID=UPI0032981EDD
HGQNGEITDDFSRFTTASDLGPGSFEPGFFIYAQICRAVRAFLPCDNGMPNCVAFPSFNRIQATYIDQ